VLLSSKPRLQGYYLLKLLALEPPLEDLRDETALGQIFEVLDDRPWRRLPDQVSDQSWADYRAEELAARDEVIGALIGGGAVGHAHDTMEPSLAQIIWSMFESQFSFPVTATLDSNWKVNPTYFSAVPRSLVEQSLAFYS